MNERLTVIVEGVQKSNTAELRDRFESINQLVAQGYNHKKVCEYLNTQGTANLLFLLQGDYDPTA